MNETESIWYKLKKDWMKSQSISDGNFGLFKLVDEYPELENYFFESLNDENRFLVANCLIGLRLMKSNKIQSIPPELFQRDEKITLVVGSFSRHYTIKKLAIETFERFK